MQRAKSIEMIRKIREDLVGTDFECYILDALEGHVSVFYTGKFLFLLNTPYGCETRRKYEPDLATKVDIVIAEEDFDLTKYHNPDYIFTNKEAHERAFHLYQKVHEKFGVPYEHLLSESYLNGLKKVS